MLCNVYNQSMVGVMELCQLNNKLSIMQNCVLVYNDSKNVLVSAGSVAHWLARLTVNQTTAGSNPYGRRIFMHFFHNVLFYIE